MICAGGLSGDVSHEREVKDLVEGIARELPNEAHLVEEGDEGIGLRGSCDKIVLV